MSAMQAFGAWPTPSTALDFKYFSEVEVQVIGTPSAAYVAQRSGDGTNFVNVPVISQDGIVLTEITAAGFYLIDGNAHVKLTGGGTGATVLVRAED